MARPANPNLREALLSAARVVFAEQGLEKTRIEDITRHAGTSKGSFYLHFQNKDEVFELVARGFIDGVLTRLRCAEEIVGTELTPTAELMRRELDHDRVFMRFLWEGRDVFRLIMEGSVGTPLHAELRNALLNGVLEHFRETLRHHAELGCGPRLDLGALALMLTGSLVMVMWQMVQKAEPDDFVAFSLTLRRLFVGGAFPPHMAGAMSLALEQAIADLESADLESADLESADLESGDLEGADLGTAELTGTHRASADRAGALVPRAPTHHPICTSPVSASAQSNAEGARTSS